MQALHVLDCCNEQPDPCERMCERKGAGPKQKLPNHLHALQSYNLPLNGAGTVYLVKAVSICLTAAESSRL
jgi:hypothetical protein